MENRKQAKKSNAKKRSARSRVHSNVFTTPFFMLTLNQLKAAGVLNEKSKYDPHCTVAVEISPTDIARLAKALAKLCKESK